MFERNRENGCVFAETKKKTRRETKPPTRSDLDRFLSLRYVSAHCQKKRDIEILLQYIKYFFAEF